MADSKGTGLEPVLDGPEAQEAKQDLVRAITALKSLLAWLEKPSNWQVSPNATFAKIARAAYPQTLPDFQNQQDEAILTLKEVYSNLFKSTGFGYKPQPVKPVKEVKSKPAQPVKGVTQPVEPVKEPVQAKKPVKTAPKQPVKVGSEAGQNG